jgi:hypothetical protein
MSDEVRRSYDEFAIRAYADSHIEARIGEIRLRLGCLRQIQGRFDRPASNSENAGEIQGLEFALRALGVNDL